MHPWKNLKVKSSELTRNASKTINTDVTFLWYPLDYVSFSFEITNQCFTLALTFDGTQQAD